MRCAPAGSQSVAYAGVACVVIETLHNTCAAHVTCGHVCVCLTLCYIGFAYQCLLVCKYADSNARSIPNLLFSRISLLLYVLCNVAHCVSICFGIPTVQICILHGVPVLCTWQQSLSYASRAYITCTYIHACMHTHIHACIHACMHTYAHIHACIHACMHMYTRAHIHSMCYVALVTYSGSLRCIHAPAGATHERTLLLSLVYAMFVAAVLRSLCTSQFACMHAYIRA